MVRVRIIKIRRTILLTLTLCSFNLPVYAKYSGGTGEPNDPYQIATAEDLMLLGETTDDYDKHFILTADIDLDPNLPGRKVFDTAVIIGSMSDQGISFTGTFDGNNHEVSHLTIVGSRDLGLFGELELGGKILNVSVKDVNVNGSDVGVGGLVGFIRPGSSVMNCHSTGTVSGYYRVGGLVGQNIGDVLHSYSHCTVSGYSTVGGLVGFNYQGKIVASFSTSQVSGDKVIGGLAGQNYGSITMSYSVGEVSGNWVGGLVGINARNITASYSSSSVTGTNWVGGLVGSMGNASSSVSDCYSTGPVSGTDNVGGLVGRSNGSITGSFWDVEASGQTWSAGGAARTTAEMQTAATFLEARWDFVDETANGTEDIWKISEGLSYPHLWWEKYSGGTGEPNDPYQIATAEDLMLLGETPEDYDKHFILTADVDLDPNLPGRKVFDKAVIAPDLFHESSPSSFQGLVFSGVFDGNGHTISRLTIKGWYYLGLFGQLKTGAEIKNLGVIDVNIIGSGHYVGGLVGKSSGMISCSYSTGVVNGDHYVGGLVGTNYYGDLITCRSTSMVAGNSYVGGLVGLSCSMWDSRGASGGRILQCFSEGNVSGLYFVGGLIGYSGSSSTLEGGGYMIHCYSTGVVSGSSNVGGLMGGEEKGIVRDCFWDIETSGQTTSAGGEGKTTAEMQTASTFLEAGWDFVDETENGTDDIWWILEGKDYPRLWWEAAEP
jgi:hypothetical protein